MELCADDKQSRETGLADMERLLLGMVNPEIAPSVSPQLKSFLSDSRCVSLLLAHVSVHPKEEVRQLAAVLLRRRIFKLWSELSLTDQNQTKEMLLQRLTQEPSHCVRMAVAYVLSAVGKMTVETGWCSKELCPMLLRLFAESGQRHEYREASLVVLTSLVDGCGESLTENYRQFAEAFGKGISDPVSAAVRVAGLRGVQALCLSSESSQLLDVLRPLLKPITHIIESSLTENNEETVQLGMEILDDMIESTNIFKKEDIPYMVCFMLKVAAKSDLDCGIRDQALNFIHWVAKNRPKALYKDGLVSKVLDVVIPMGAVEEPEDASSDETTPHQIASQCIDSLAVNLPNKYIYAPVVERLQPYAQSTNPHEKKAALVLLGIMSEGCEAIMRQRLDEILPFVFTAFQDLNPQVRAAAAACFSQLAEFLQPEIFAFHEEAMKHLLALIDLPHREIQDKACYALEVFCEELGAEEIKPYLPSLLPKLVNTLKMSSSSDVRENCLGAIGAVAASADKEFGPYAVECLTLLRDILMYEGTSEEVTTVKAKAAESVGVIAKSIGHDFLPHKDGFMQLVCKNVQLADSHQIRRAAFLFFGSLAESLKDGYADFLERTMVYVFASILSSDGLEAPASAEGGLDSDNEDQDDDDDGVMNVRTGYLDELESAVGCLVALWGSCPLHCMKYLEKTTEAIEILHQHFANDVRELTASLMASVLKGVHQQFRTEVKEFQPGLPIQSQFIHPHTMKLWDSMFWTHFSKLLNDDEKETVTGVATTLGELFEELGPQLIAEHIAELVEFLGRTLENKHACQAYTEIDEDEDSRQEEEQLFEGISVLISGMSKALGGQFASIYAKIHPRILALSTHRHSSAYRCIGLGCAAAAFQSMGTSAAPFVESLVQPALQGIQQKDDLDLKRNAAFASGILVQVDPSLAEKGVMLQFLKAMHSIFVCVREELNEKKHLVLDNAIAATARFLLNSNSTQIPLADVVPVCLNQLPLEEDMEESDIVMQALLRLFAMPEAQPYIQEHIAKFLTITIGEVTSEKTTINEETKAKVLEMNATALRQLGPANPILMEITKALPNKAKTQDYLSATLL